MRFPNGLHGRSLRRARRLALLWPQLRWGCFVRTPNAALVAVLLRGFRRLLLELHAVRPFLSGRLRRGGICRRCICLDSGRVLRRFFASLSCFVRGVGLCCGRLAFRPVLFRRGGTRHSTGLAGGDQQLDDARLICAGGQLYAALPCQRAQLDHGFNLEEMIFHKETPFSQEKKRLNRRCNA